jgi:flagellum-specific ATP synthase
MTTASVDHLSQHLHAARSFPLIRREGAVSMVSSLGIECVGPPCAMGESCTITTLEGRAVDAEVVAIKGASVTLLPYGDCSGVTVGNTVTAQASVSLLPAGRGLLGRVVDAFGQPLDGRLLEQADRKVPLHAAPINPLQRSRVDKPLHTGLRCIDALLPLGRGQRVGIFAGSGVGKSSLLAMLAKNVSCDVNVIALIGERGREVEEFVSSTLSAEARAKTVVVVATPEHSAVVRSRAAYAATAIAEDFRSQGAHVLFLMDSVTRFAMARREIDLAAGQPPATRGYTPSVFSAIPALCERGGGLRDSGSITSLFTVLVEGDDHDEPVADILRSSLDGHIVLSKDLANEGHYPAIDVLRSVSRLESNLLDAQALKDARALRALMAIHQRHREMVDMGLYKSGANPELDRALSRWPQIKAFLVQAAQDVSNKAQTESALRKLVTVGSSS